MSIGTADYRPGECNIGPAEIRRRQLAGHAGLVASVVLLAILVVIDAPPIARMLLIAPAVMSASGYLQAGLRFCAAFGSRGTYNFDRPGQQTRVGDEHARAADRRRARQIGLWSLVIGIAAGVIAVQIPI